MADCQKVSMGTLASPSTIFKRKFRWTFRTLNYVGDGVGALPPLKSARPSLEFKDIDVPHTVEDIYIPGKATWRPINLILYDVCPPTDHPVWKWVKEYYDVENDEWYACCDKQFRVDSCLELLTGGGDTMERWIFENSFPSQVNWGDLDYGSSEFVTCEILLRYDRACWYRSGSCS